MFHAQLKDETLWWAVRERYMMRINDCDCSSTKCTPTLKESQANQNVVLL